MNKWHLQQFFISENKDATNMNTDNGALRQMENEDENLENTFEKCVTNV